MAGLLDFIKTPEGQGLLSAAFGGLAGARRGTPFNNLGRAGLAGLGGYVDATDRMTQQAQIAKRDQMYDLQLKQAQQQMADAEARKLLAQQSAMSPGAMAVSQNGGPTLAAAQALPTTQPGFDFNRYAQGLAGLGDVQGAMAIQQAMKKDTTPIKLAAGETLVEPGTYKPVFSAPNKPAEQPSAVREYEYAKSQGYGGTFEQFQLAQRKAGATNIGMPKIEVKMGESVAGQIGPMAKDSRTQAQGAVGMFDSADRIQKALDSGKVSAGPFTTQVQTVKQLVQKVGGGNDEGIRQTRQVIKGLAQMSVEARKQLAGQGQITESEAAAVAKAESGDINDLTTGELQDLVTLTKRAAHYRAKNHQSILDSMGASDATKGMVPFYQIQNMDKLLKYTPQLPQIGGGSAVDAALQKYGK